MNLRGKVVDFLGDSITEGFGIEACLDKRYDNIIKEKCGLKNAYNYGIGGTRIAYQMKPSEEPVWDLYFCGRVYLMNKEADVIVVYGGVNDYTHGDAPFGKMGDTTPQTYCGAVDFLMNKLNELYPNAAKVFMTPARMQYENMNDEKPSPRSMKYSDAKPLVDYGRVINETAEKYNIKVLDLYERLPINPNIAADKEKYTIDGLHFSAEGHKVLADTLINFIENEM